MQYVEVTEGETKLKVPEGKIRSKRDPVFYNPVMEQSRDLSVAVARILRPSSYCDVLAGSGARGIRIAREAGLGVVLNDLNPVACELASENAGLNGVSVEVSNDDANHFLSDKKFDFVDVDPFGPPVRYLDAAIKALPKTGFLGVAATDTSCLCGTYPRACKRKYDAASLRTDYYDELGLRILLGFIARNAVRYDFGVNFLFSHSTRHYMRSYAKLSRGSKGVRETQDNVSFIQHCFSCLDKSYRRLTDLERTCSCGGVLFTAGPLWAGRFADGDFCGKLEAELSSGVFNTQRDSIVLVRKVSGEQGETKPYFDLHKLCRVAGVSAPKTSDFADSLGKSGFSFSKTHFCDTGFRTDACASDLSKLIKSFV
ncbi:MAG: tRNA (guanine(10)-N(2))-dimethyltransferase [Candidatus Altiarchaeota archaeon]